MPGSRDGFSRWRDPRDHKLQPTLEEHMLAAIQRLDDHDRDIGDMLERIEAIETIRDMAWDIVKYLWKDVLRFLAVGIAGVLLIRFGKMTADQAADLLKQVAGLG